MPRKKKSGSGSRSAPWVSRPRSVPRSVSASKSRPQSAPDTPRRQTSRASAASTTETQSFVSAVDGMVDAIAGVCIKPKSDYYRQAERHASESRRARQAKIIGSAGLPAMARIGYDATSGLMGAFSSICSCGSNRPIPPRDVDEPSAAAANSLVDDYHSEQSQSQWGDEQSLPSFNDGWSVRSKPKTNRTKVDVAAAQHQRAGDQLTQNKLARHEREQQQAAAAQQQHVGRHGWTPVAGWQQGSASAVDRWNPVPLGCSNLDGYTPQTATTSSSADADVALGARRLSTIKRQQQPHHFEPRPARADAGVPPLPFAHQWQNGEQPDYHHPYRPPVTPNGVDSRPSPSSFADGDRIIPPPQSDAEARAVWLQKKHLHSPRTVPTGPRAPPAGLVGAEMTTEQMKAYFDSRRSGVGVVQHWQPAEAVQRVKVSQTASHSPRPAGPNLHAVMARLPPLESIVLHEDFSKEERGY